MKITSARREIVKYQRNIFNAPSERRRKLSRRAQRVVTASASLLTGEAAELWTRLTLRFHCASCVPPDYLRGRFSAITPHGSVFFAASSTLITIRCVCGGVSLPEVPCHVPVRTHGSRTSCIPLEDVFTSNLNLLVWGMRRACR